LIRFDWNKLKNPRRASFHLAERRACCYIDLKQQARSLMPFDISQCGTRLAETVHGSAFESI
jgi:hypothetical protein